MVRVYQILLRFFSILPVAFSFISCHVENDGADTGKRITGSASSILYAERFSLERLEGYTRLTVIDPWQGAQGISQEYYLVKRGDKIPAGAGKNNVIFVPVRNIICMSTTHVAMISALKQEGTISAVSGAAFVCDKKLSGLISGKKVADIGYDSGINKELIIRISPELIMMYGIGNESAGHINKIEELGFSTVFNADYLETDPLGKAEWIKLFGALFCREAMADSIFREISYEYLGLKDFIKRNVSDHPRVLLGLPYKDTWFISPGNSYISRIISDAGGEYLWHDVKSMVSMPFGIENVYVKATTADYWLNTGIAGNRAYIESLDPRLAALPCFRKGNLYNNNRRLNENGGNDYWESGSLHPEVVLRDIASILHPGLFDGDLYYYRKLD